MIRVDVTARLSQENKPPSDNAVQASVQQCVDDAVQGSFDEYPAHLQGMVRLRATLLSGWTVTEEATTYRQIHFALGLPDDIFPVEYGGLQLLVNLLAGDIFPSEVSGCRWSEVTVRSLELPILRARSIARFRSNAHDIGSLRSTFGLAPNRPLLAFSLKPRVGPTFAEIRRVTLDVLNAGFNIVELDTRSLALASIPVERWVELGIEAAGKGKHVTAFSPNLTIPAPQLLDVAARWVTEVGPHGPPVLKVDGGLDGLTNLQSLRTALPGDRSPIVTSYPLLHKQLASAIGNGTWTTLLGLSGADIVYPGGRPSFPNERRPVWASHVKDWFRAAGKYDGMIRQGWPMPTVAGGIHPGHLHACYELFGPNVAYFLGGAVALHPTSIEDGAKLCVEVLEDAISLVGRAGREGADHSGDLPRGLLTRLERTRYPTTRLNYVSPANIFGPTAEAGPRPFYHRPA